MKHFILILTISFLGLQLAAQAPQGINYQAVARNNMGDPIPNTSVTVNFKIRQGSASGNIVFEETQNKTTDACGMFNLKIGQANAPAFSAIDWSTGSKFLEVTINGTVSGTTEMLSVPYALYAEKSKTTIIHVTATQSGDFQDNVRTEHKPVPGVQVTVPESGTYLILANLGGSATLHDSGLSGWVRKLIVGGTQDIFDFRIHGKLNNMLAESQESTGWTIAVLTKNDVLRLDYYMGSFQTPNDGDPYSVNRGKLMLVKLN